jgi:hypothetical protein
MIFHKYPEWSVGIRNHYWYLRAVRKFNSAKLRKYYRLIEKEKKRLHETGVDKEVVRLLCRHIVNPRNPFAEQRFWEAFHKTTQKPLQLSE